MWSTDCRRRGPSAARQSRAHGVSLQSCGGGRSIESRNFAHIFSSARKAGDGPKFAHIFTHGRGRPNSRKNMSKLWPVPRYDGPTHTPLGYRTRSRERRPGPPTRQSALNLRNPLEFWKRHSGTQCGRLCMAVYWRGEATTLIVCVLTRRRGDCMS